MQKFMSSEDFGLAMFQAQTNYADISAFFGSDRRTGHRWQEDGPSNQVSRLMQLMCALGLTLADVRLLISHGIKKGGTPLPDKVVSIETQLEILRRQEVTLIGTDPVVYEAKGRKRSRHPERSKNWSPKDIEKAARIADSTGFKGGAGAARGGKGASNDRRSKSRAPKARQPASAAV